MKLVEKLKQSKDPLVAGVFTHPIRFTVILICLAGIFGCNMWTTGRKLKRERDAANEVKRNNTKYFTELAKEHYNTHRRAGQCRICSLARNVAIKDARANLDKPVLPTTINRMYLVRDHRVANTAYTTISKTCAVTGEFWEVRILTRDWNNWNHGVIKDIPHLTRREKFLINRKLTPEEVDHLEKKGLRPN